MGEGLRREVEKLYEIRDDHVRSESEKLLNNNQSTRGRRCMQIFVKVCRPFLEHTFGVI